MSRNSVNLGINDGLCQQFTPYQPPYAKNWGEFDRKIIELSKEFDHRQSSKNPFLSIFNQLHLMSRVAMHNRHIGRYEMALALYSHVMEHARLNNLIPKQVPRYFVGHASNMSVLYRNWACMTGSDSETIKLRKKSINQCKLMRKYIEMESQSRKNNPSNKLLQIAYFRHYNDSEWSMDLNTAKMHTELANNMHRLCDHKNNPNAQTVRKCEYHFRKALDIHSANDFGVDTYYFFDTYVNWIYEVRNDMRTNQKLIRKLLERNLSIATREFGKFSFEVVCCYRGLARYFAFYLSKHKVAIQYYFEALSLLEQCITMKRVDKVQLTETHPQFFTLHYTIAEYQSHVAELYDMRGDWQNALLFYRKVVCSADIALKLNPLNQAYFTQMLSKYKKESVQSIRRIRNYSDFEKEKQTCKNCRKMRKKYYTSFGKKWVGGREKCLQSISGKQDVSLLKNIANAKQCALCKSNRNKLSKCSRCQKAYYCNRKHQKLHWKVHKKECSLINKQ